MPRIMGVDIPKEKRIDISLRYLFGVGPTIATKIVKEAQIPPEKRAGELTQEKYPK